MRTFVSRSLLSTGTFSRFSIPILSDCFPIQHLDEQISSCEGIEEWIWELDGEGASV